MVLYLGQNVAVPFRDVLFILSADVMNRGENRRFLRRAERQGRLIRTEAGETQSVVITCTDGVTRCYLSTISPETLKKRMLRVQSGALTVF